VSTEKQKQGNFFKHSLNKFLAKRLETILAVAGSKMYRSFLRTTKDVEGTQNAVLREIMTYAEGTEFGKKHHFERVRSYDDYCTNLPILDYEDHRPFVNKHAAGKENILFPGKPIMYNRSSGTTTEPKLIPVTPYNFQRTIKNRGKLWLYGLSRHYPGIYKGKSLSVVSPAVEGYTEDGTPFGSLSGVMRENIPEFMKLTHAAPYAATLIDDYDAKVYSILRLGLANDVTVILTGNPATVLNLVTKADAWKQDIIRDINDGTLKNDLQISTEIRRELEDGLRPMPKRAGELERLSSQSDRLRPRDYWPNLGLIHTWKNGNTRLVIPKLKDWFHEQTPILDFGYIASEILATDLIDPETDGSILQIQNGFYEFCPVEERDAPKAKLLLAHQLAAGERYYIFVTTLSGLYRYDMNDVIEVVGHLGGAPIIRFMYKGKGITNIQGEKLSEEQFIEAVHRAAKKSDAKHDFFIGYAEPGSRQYTLYIEFTDNPKPEQIAAFAGRLDSALCEVNVEYEAKFHSSRLYPIQVVPVGEDFFSRYRQLRFEEGTHEGQIKWLQLTSTEADRQRIEKLIAVPKPGLS